MESFTRRQKRGKWRKRLIIALVTILVIALAVAGGFYFKKQSEANAKKARESSILQSKKDKEKAIADAKALEEKHLQEEPLYAKYKSDGLTYDMIQKAKTMKATFIGDSVMLGSEYGFKELFPQATLDSSVSRQAYEAPELIDKHVKAGNAGEAIIVNLGTNGNITKDNITDVLKSAGNRPVYWIIQTIDRDWDKPNKEALDDAAKENKQLHVIRWDEEVAKNDTKHTWFTQDGVHPSVEGQRHYYTFVARNVLAGQLKK